MNLLDIDIYIDKEIKNDSVKIFNEDICELNEVDRFDLFMFNHLFKHK